MEHTRAYYQRNWGCISVRGVTRGKARDGKLEGWEMEGRLVNVRYVYVA